MSFSEVETGETGENDRGNWARAFFVGTAIGIRALLTAKKSNTERSLLFARFQRDFTGLTGLIVTLKAVRAL